VVSLLLGHVGAIALVVVDANTLVVLEVTGHESVVVRVLAHTEASDSNAVQGVHVIVCRTGVLRVLRVLGLLGSRSSRDLASRTGVGNGGSSHRQVMTRLAEVNVWGSLWNVKGGLHQAALQGEDIITQGVVLV
jgi:hypothetical protein